VFTALVLLIILIDVTPAIVFVDGPATYGAVALIAASALAIISIAIRPGEASHLQKVASSALLLLVIPAIWILVQLFPMPLRWSHPIWTSAAEALGTPLFGRLSIDLGASVIGLIRYLTAVAILMAASAVAIDRTRAESLLSWLTGATAFLAAMLIAHHFGGLLDLAEAGAVAALQAASALGITTAAATTIRSIERYETRRNTAEMTRSKFAWVLTAALSAFAMCWLAVLIAAPRAVTFAAGCGCATVMLAVMIRRFGLGPWAGGSTVAVAIVATIAIAASSNPGSGDVTLRFAAEAAPSALSMAGRIINDNHGGTGVGTFKALLPIYRTIDEAAVPETAPTAAAQWTIEMGRAAPWVVVLMVLIATTLLMRGAMSRGRDSFYAIAAAGSLMTLTLEAFVDTSLLGTAVVILAAALLGLGLAQSTSRTIQ
jgi:hypothetical protein